MPRALWTGSVSFGLVNVPIRIYSATQEHDLHFHYIHEPDGSRIGYEKICKAEGKPVRDDEIVKAFEWEKGEWVYMADEDFEAAQAEGHRTIEITEFVPYEEIDPIFFEKTYYLSPPGRRRARLRAARARAREVRPRGVSKFVMRDRQHLGCLRVRDDMITLERMYFADEVRPTNEVAPEDAKVDKRELEMATELIDRFSGSWEPERYKDTYRETLCEIIKKKRRGEKVHVEAEPEPEEPADLMEALRASLEAAQKDRKAAPRRSTARKRGPERKAKTKSGGARGR